jgi:hypothetical protein
MAGTGKLAPSLSENLCLRALEEKVPEETTIHMLRGREMRSLASFDGLRPRLEPRASDTTTSLPPLPRPVTGIAAPYLLRT